jgi:acid phosphatase
MGHRAGRSSKVLITIVAALALTLAPMASASAAKTGPLGTYKHIVIIYEENHSFDNLYGNWGSVDGQHVVGRADADAAHTTQVAWDGTPYACMLQKDVNLTTPPLAASTTPDCSAASVTLEDGSVLPFASHFGNAPYNIDQYIPATATTCPTRDTLFAFPNGILDGSGLPGGCTRDLVHRFYQEQYQLNGGHMNRYMTGSDSAGMSMGYYDTTKLPLYGYLHKKGAPNYVIADHFFQAAFGGSFLNHQYLIAAAAPSYPDSYDSPVTGTTIPLGKTHSILDGAGMPRGKANPYPLYKTNTTTLDGNTLQTCGLPTTVAGLACGDLAVNTVLPWYQPTSTGFANKIPPIDDTSTPMTIGDLMTDAGISWAYYGGGWDNAAGNTTGRGYTNGPGPTCGDPNSAPAPADGNGQNAGYPYCPDKSYQQHHYPFAYFARYAPTMPDRSHLQDEKDFMAAVSAGKLPKVSFVKPLGIENEHPGYASEPNGSDHLVSLVDAIVKGPQAGNTLIVVTYDEFGGQWDHVPPPGMGTTGVHDQFGPGTRIPAILIGRSLTRSGVDHTVYDTTSIMRTIEEQFGLASLTARDAAVNDLGPAVKVGRPKP